MTDLKPLDVFAAELDGQGWSLFPDLLPRETVQALRADSLKWVEICRGYQVRNGINADGDGTAHHSIGAGDSIDAFIDSHYFDAHFQQYFARAPYILHACNPVGGFPGQRNYVHNIHRDVRTFIPGYNMRMNVLVMLDDFTEENGATHVLSGSHHRCDAPTEAEFDAGFERLTGKAGSVVLFNSYLWHRGGLNRTQRPRVALTLSYGPAFIKPQMDYARLLGEAYGRTLSAQTRQVLGYNSRVPTTLDEWYRPAADRLYQSHQG
jgi:ectoine hydroxylase-related dioxygenase (phytanoyl-CoA dioxygenase family)